MIIDSHCHLDDYENLPAILANAKSVGVEKLLAIGIGDGPSTMHRALEIANSHTSSPEIYASAGIHPQEAHQATEENLAKLSKLAEDPRCIAIGEIGLDYYHFDNPAVDIQQAAFVAQLEIAAKARKPILIHLRTSELATPNAKARFAPHDATADFFRLIEQHWAPTGRPGVMHCFSGSQADADRALALGFYLSFAGNLTYPKSTVIQAVAATAPSDRILVETDAPFLAPIPLRGQQNEPANTAITAKFLANLRGTTTEQIAEKTTANFHALFPSTLA
jgi:TatD DNase family protein